MGLVSCAGPMCLGHESSGIVVRLGSNLAAKAREAKAVEEKLAQSSAKAEAVVGPDVLKVGTRVTLEPGVTCRMCHDCRGGRYNVSSRPGRGAITDEADLRAYGFCRIPSVRRNFAALL